MTRKRVVVVVGSLLASGVASLLRGVPDIELLPVREEGESVYERIRTSEADVIVVEAGRAQNGPPISIDRLLRDNPRARVIALGLDRLDLDVYRSERVECASVADLLATIQETRTAEARDPRGPAASGRE